MTQDFCPTCGRPDGAGHTNQECFAPAGFILRSIPIFSSKSLGTFGAPTPWWEGALIRWQNSAIHPGDFLTAVLCNDLFGAWGRADEFCKADMDLIVKFVYNQLPGDCWGTKERMATWKGL